MSTLRSTAGRARALMRHRGPNDPATQSAFRDHAVASLREHIEKVTTEWPSLLPDQRKSLAAELMRGSEREGTSA